MMLRPCCSQRTQALQLSRSTGKSAGRSTGSRERSPGSAGTTAIGRLRPGMGDTEARVAAGDCDQLSSGRTPGGHRGSRMGRMLQRSGMQSWPHGARGLGVGRSGHGAALVLAHQLGAALGPTLTAGMVAWAAAPSLRAAGRGMAAGTGQAGAARVTRPCLAPAPACALQSHAATAGLMGWSQRRPQLHRCQPHLSGCLAASSGPSSRETQRLQRQSVAASLTVWVVGQRGSLQCLTG
mmetsp:Transcript_22353/g.56892  ORF Transcript_22353/g.56892 Transcript_22353/m.56892 type:complete len:238 (-) Transcript_22353:444-1157(-)